MCHTARPRRSNMSTCDSVVREQGARTCRDAAVGSANGKKEWRSESQRACGRKSVGVPQTFDQFEIRLRRAVRKCLVTLADSASDVYRMSDKWRNERLGRGTRGS